MTRVVGQWDGLKTAHRQLFGAECKCTLNIRDIPNIESALARRRRQTIPGTSPRLSEMDETIARYSQWIPRLQGRNGTSTQLPDTM